MIPLIIGATTMQVVGQVKAGNAAKKTGEMNAQLAEQQSADALARGREEEQGFRLGVKGLIGSQRAGFASQGVDVNQGSALDVQADAAFLGELDALRIRTNAQREAHGYQQQAEIYRAGGQAAQTASRWQGVGTALGGAVQSGSVMAARYGWGSGSPTGGGTTPIYYRGRLPGASLGAEL